MLLCRSPLQVTPVHLGKETLGVTTELAAADGHQLSRHGHRAQSLATMTSEALITAYAGSPAFRPSSSTASLVMDEVMMVPPPTSIFTWAVVAPRFTSRILPLMIFRALRRMLVSFLVMRGLLVPAAGRHGQARSLREPDGLQMARGPAIQRPHVYVQVRLL